MKDVVEMNIIIHKQTKEDIKQQLIKLKYLLKDESYDYLLKLPIYSLTKEEIDKLTKERDNLIFQSKELSNKSPEDIWLSELNIFTKEYNKYLKKNIE